MRPSPLSARAITLALIGILFGAAFLIGRATAESDRGEVGQPRPLRASVVAARVPVLKAVEDLPSLREREHPKPPGDNPPDGDPPPDPPGDDPPPPPPVNEPPIASFIVEPETVLTGETVSFSAGDSRDPDGSILKYEWDLDGDGSFETENGSENATSSYQAAGRRTVSLRVTDDDNGTAKTTRSVTVDESPAPSE